MHREFYKIPQEEGRLILDVAGRTFIPLHKKHTPTFEEARDRNRVFRDIPASPMALGTNYPISITREIQFAD